MRNIDSQPARAWLSRNTSFVISVAPVSQKLSRWLWIWPYSFQIKLAWLERSSCTYDDVVESCWCPTEKMSKRNVEVNYSFWISSKVVWYPTNISSILLSSFMVYILLLFLCTYLFMKGNQVHYNLTLKPASIWEVRIYFYTCIKSGA